MSTGALIELRPERRLLNHNFEGYKLSLAALAHWSHQLQAPPDVRLPAEPQYSFTHAKLFAFHQHLRPDLHHHSHLLFYIDSTHHVHGISFDPISHEIVEKIVYDIPAHVEKKPGQFNPCLFFPSPDYAVVSDGTGYIHIVFAESRNDLNSQWKTILSERLLEDEKYFVIVDCRLEEKNSEIIHCLIESIEHSEERFSTVLTWVGFAKDSEGWKLRSTRVIKGKGPVHYAAIETECSAVYVVSDHHFKFISDTERDIDDNPKVEEPKKIIYTWLQTADDITITLKLPEKFSKDNVHIDIAPTQIKISYAGTMFIDGKFRHKIDSELTTWNVEDDGKLDILITKSETAIWDEMISGGDSNGEQILDAALVEEAHQRLAHLCSETEAAPEGDSVGFSTQELEECDAASEEDTVLVRLDAADHKTTHRIPLSVHLFLFSVNLEPREVPALALRHDVDACVWQPYSHLFNQNTWPVKHHGTLMAFGYVQSSKQNKKFVTCSPNFAYSVVCEATKHVFIYRTAGPTSQGCQLRKRGEGGVKNVSVGQQHVFNVDKFGEVLGIHASNEYLFLLTSSNLVVIELI